ncbi:pilus assembly protein TadG-related protein [Taklimakanibacter lacteus]|uniref:pilus assembly protein TadG-related protein n=1 Tax=Taklimakanibacter lacteus TaxID=2268456 RepID=UPI000E66F394
MIRFSGWLKDLLRDERGSTAVAFAASMPLVVAGAAFGVETSYWYYKDLQLQAAADAAAYAGALEKRAGSKYDDVLTAAKAVAVTNGFDSSIGSAELNSPPHSGTHINSKAVEVVLEEGAERFFSSLFTQAPVTVRARAVATYEDAGSACVLALDKSASKAALFSGSSISKFKKCSVMANSLASDAVTVQGSGKLQTSCIYSVGGASLLATTILDDCKSAQVGVSPVADPYGEVAAPAVDGTCADASGPTLSAGTYCGGLTLKDTMTLNPGVYVVSGGDLKVNANADISGSGVMFYLTNGARVSMNGTATVNLSAATTGTYAGILFFGDRADTGATKNSFNGTADSQLTGAIYFASQAIQFLGDFSGADGCTQVVGLTVEWSGNAEISKDCSAHGMTAIPAAELVKLVE